MARIATTPLRSTPIANPRSPAALAKSKPYKLCLVLQLQLKAIQAIMFVL